MVGDVWTVDNASVVSGLLPATIVLVINGALMIGGISAVDSTPTVDGGREKEKGESFICKQKIKINRGFI